VDAAFMGLQLDEQLDSSAQLRRTVNDLADAVVARWGPFETPRPSAPQDKQPGNA
jgi:hypothetical protein